MAGHHHEARSTPFSRDVFLLKGSSELEIPRPESHPGFPRWISQRICPEILHSPCSVEAISSDLLLMFSSAPFSCFIMVIFVACSSSETQGALAKTNNPVLVSHCPSFVCTFSFRLICIFVDVICIIVRLFFYQLVFLPSALKYSHKLDCKSHIPSLGVPGAMYRNKKRQKAAEKCKSVDSHCGLPRRCACASFKGRTPSADPTTQRDVPCMMQSLANTPGFVCRKTGNDRERGRKERQGCVG